VSKVSVNVKEKGTGEYKVCCVGKNLIDCCIADVQEANE
jgi:hypothetical protein